MSIPHLTFTRFIAALSVFIFHFAINGGNKVFPFYNHYLTRIFSNGDLAVSYFFMLSGFIMAIAYYKENNNLINIKTFYISRFARVYPIYILSIILYVMTIPLPQGAQSVSLFVWLINCLLIQSWFRDATLNFAAWSLSVEIFFYLTFPFLLYGIKKLSPVSLMLLFFFTMVFYYYIKLYANHNSLHIPPPLLYLPVFVIGITIGVYYKCVGLSFPERRPSFRFLIVLSVVACFTLLIASILFFESSVKNDYIPIFLYALLITLFAYDQSVTSKLFSAEPLILLGNISYSLYILQFPLKFWFDFFCGGQIPNPTISFYTFFLFCLIVCYTLFLLVEEPCRKRLRSLLN